MRDTLAPSLCSIRCSDTVDLSLLANHRHQTAPDTVQLGKALHVGDEVCGQILRAPQRRVFSLRLGKVLTAVVPAVQLHEQGPGLRHVKRVLLQQI